jgi:3-methyladenine DNA glycosylase AlkD
MKAHEILQEMESLGTEQNRKIYARHGVTDPMFGVSYANFDKLQKRIKKNHALTLELWESGNHDARVLAMRIVDPTQITAADVERWASELNNYTLTDAVAGTVAQASIDHATITAWTYADDEWLARIGWRLVASLAMENNTLPDDFFLLFLERITTDIHQGKNRVREAMNGTLIAIGTRNAEMERKAIEIAGVIGKVYVDHGQTGCKTPDAASYIRKTNEHNQKRATAKMAVAP